MLPVDTALDALWGIGNRDSMYQILAISGWGSASLTHPAEILLGERSRIPTSAAAVRLTLFFSSQIGYFISKTGCADKFKRSGHRTPYSGIGC
jgi:hypothetical protein